MDKFLGINWHPSIEDVVDNAFVRDERLETESITHKSLIGKWRNPFEDIQEDYKEVDLNNIPINRKSQPNGDGTGTPAAKGATKGAAKGVTKGPGKGAGKGPGKGAMKGPAKGATKGPAKVAANV